MVLSLYKVAKWDNLGEDNVTMVSCNDCELSHFADDEVSRGGDR